MEITEDEEEGTAGRLEWVGAVEEMAEAPAYNEEEEEDGRDPVLAVIVCSGSAAARKGPKLGLKGLISPAVDEEEAVEAGEEEEESRGK